MMTTHAILKVMLIKNKVFFMEELDLDKRGTGSCGRGGVELRTHPNREGGGQPDTGLGD